MKKEKGKMSVFYIIILALAALIGFAVLELGKNTLLGWGIALAALIGLIVLEIFVTKKNGFFIHLMLVVAFIGVIAGAYFASYPPYKCTPAVDNKTPK
ncbi:MAG: hypothetical protein IJ927_05570 [Eubacterium sp.]|nr:hypothetical protein [Eubacterium sp.]